MIQLPVVQGFSSFLPGAAIDPTLPDAKTEFSVNPAVSVRDFLHIFSAVMLPMFLASVDQTLLATATPAIAAELGGLSDTSWIAVGYLLAATVMGPLYGRLGDRYGRREMLMLAVGAFAAGSVACALAPSMGALVAARAVQGLGGGGLMVMAQALIGELVPPRQRGRFQGYFASVFTLASVSGPVIGGFVVTHASWRWLFWVNVPLCAFAGWRLSRIARPAAAERGAPIEDLLGVAWFAAATTSTLLWVSFGGHRFDWLSLAGLALGLGSALLWAGLLGRERRLAVPFLPVELLREPAIRLISATVACFTACMFSLIFFLPIYLQLGHRVSAADAGVLLLPLTFGLVTGSTTTGRIVSRTGRIRKLPAIGLSWSACMLLLLGLLPPSTTAVGLLGFGIGLGFGTVMPCAQLVVQTVAGRARLGAAAATVSLARSLGSATGTALFGSVVFALLQGLNLGSALHGTSDATLVIHAFHACFLGAACIAATGAWIASRMPAVKL
ncbi:MAG TPA: MFS transporter [Burkholderiales bacterium]|nr:MFS transporter [Burkholderiales bacterium]